MIAASLTEAGTKSTEQAAWRTALDPKGDWVPHVIAAMDERLTQLRESGMPDAAGLVLASDQDDARAYAQIVQRVTGEKPYLILSDDPKASDKIAQFAAGGARIAVCVRMVSEGVDVPRAACLAWLTSYRTPLFFAQAVGRVVRSRGRHESATVFLPAVRPLLSLAAELETERNHVLPPPAALRHQPGTGGRAGRGAARAGRVGAAGRVGGAGGRGPVRACAARWPGDDRTSEREPSADDEDFLGLPGLLTAEQTAALLSRRDGELRKRASQSRQQASLFDAPAPASRGGGRKPRTNWRAAAELRKEVNRLVAVLAARTGTPHGQLHARLRSEVPGPPSASASVELLEARRDRLMAML